MSKATRPYAISLERQTGAGDEMADWPEEMLLEGNNNHALFHMAEGDVGASIYQIYEPPLKFAYPEGEAWDVDEIVIILDGKMTYWRDKDDQNPVEFSTGDILWVPSGMGGIQRQEGGASGIWREIAVHPSTSATSRFVEGGESETEVVTADKSIVPESVPTDRQQGPGDGIPPFPAEMILEGESEHSLHTFCDGDVVIAAYQAKPIKLKIDAASAAPGDEIRKILEGELRIQLDGEDEPLVFPAGSMVFIPKGTTGVVEMASDSGLYREINCSSGAVNA